MSLPSSEPWNGWYHLTAHTYGSWLRGDPRGWRARHHREHVEGDYRNPPPPGTYAQLHELSKSLMTRDPVRIAAALRPIVVGSIVEKLLRDGVEVLIASVESRHLHVLARFPDRDPRHWLGRAKKHASHNLREQGLRAEEGGLWAKRSHAGPFADRAHQLKVFHYIRNHRHQGAALWTFTPPRRDA